MLRSFELSSSYVNRNLSVSHTVYLHKMFMHIICNRRPVILFTINTGFFGRCSCCVYAGFRSVVLLCSFVTAHRISADNDDCVRTICNFVTGRYGTVKNETSVCLTPSVTFLTYMQWQPLDSEMSGTCGQIRTHVLHHLLNSVSPSCTL